MFYQQDWILRQIEIIIYVMNVILFGRDSDYSEHKVELKDAPAGEDMSYRIMKLFYDGDICSAENMLFEWAQTKSESALRTAMELYSKANKLTDEQLEKMNFSHAEILEGLRDIMKIYELPYETIMKGVTEIDL